MVDVAIIGAGPYGLSIAAHLNDRGVDFCIFGRPMNTWRNHMPKGMFLKSDGFASSLSAPAQDYSLKSYCSRNGIAYDDFMIPVALSTFTAYALDFQRKFVPQLDTRDVTSLIAAENGFVLTLCDGERVRARRVVLAIGISHFDYLPSVLGTNDGHFVSHSSAHRDLEKFCEKDVTVIGAGASALNLAAGLHEAGANVRLIARSAHIRFSSPPEPDKPNLWQRLRHPSSGLGPGLRSRLFCELPHGFRYLPAFLRLMIVRRHLGPSSPSYLRPRVMGKVKVMTDHEVESLDVRDDHVQLGLRNGKPEQIKVSTDHVVAATGYRVDLKRLLFIDNDLRAHIRTTGSMPRLSASFESSVPGLYFAGLAAAGSFGPLLRFVYGTEFAARRISQHIAQRRQNG